MIVKETNFVTFSYFSESSIMRLDWHLPSIDMTSQDFQDCIYLEKSLFLLYKPTKILANTLNMHYAIDPEEQDWHNSIISPTFQAIGLQRLAIIVSNDIFAQVSISQLLEDDNLAQYKTSYFVDESAGLSWLTEIV